jgi:hypothetical protein
MRWIRLRINWARALMKMLPPTHIHSTNAPFTHSIRWLTTQINTELAEFPTWQGVHGHFGVACALRSCFAGSACGWKLYRLGIPPQARKPYESPSYHGRFHSNYPSNLPSLPTDSTPHSIPTLESTIRDIHVIWTVFPRANPKPISIPT